MKTFFNVFRVFLFFIIIGFSLAACKEPTPHLSGSVSIDGFAYTFMPLTANTDALGGSGKISYQWRLDGVNIDGAKEKTYSVQLADVGASITVRVTRAGYSGGIVSEPAQADLPPLTGKVTIDGPAHTGKTITVNTSDLRGQGKTSYQWMLDGKNIDGANNNNFLIRHLDAGSTFTVKVTRAGNKGEVISEPTDVVLSALTGKVSIEGVAHKGEILIANIDALSGNGTVSYQWKLDGKNISEANGSTYTVKPNDEGLPITVEVTRNGYWGEVISEPAPIYPPLTGKVSIVGQALIGQTLTANTDDLGGEGVVSYQWSRNGISISGTSSVNYLLQSADEGSTMTVKVTRTGNVGEKISEPTDIVRYPIIAVTNISNVPSAAIIGKQLTLTGTVTPSNATNKTIIWTIKSAGTTGASINGNTLSATDTGTAGIRATITNGVDYGIDYTQDYSITAEEPIYFDQWVTRINFGSSSTATVDFKNMENHDLYLVKVNTGSSNVTATNTGLVTNVTPSSNEMPSIMPQFSEILNSKQRPVMGHPNADKFPLPQPVPYEPSVRPLSKVLAYAVGDTRSFWLDNNLSGTNFTQQQAVLLATAERSNIWVINNSISVSQAQAMAEKFDVLYPATTNIFGYEFGGRPGHSVPGGVDGDPKIQILVYPIGGSNSNVLGYFWPKDYYPDPYQGLRSNQAEIFYINANYVHSNPLMIYDTLTHEFQHMIHFNVKRVENGKNSSTWYNEMMSMISEDIISDLIPIPTTSSDHVSTSTIYYFNEYYALEGFTDWESSNIPSNNYWPYASKFTFGAYLVRNYGGAEFVRKLSANNLVDVDSISAAINEMAPGVTFNEALLRFAEVLVYSGSKTPAGVNTLDKTVAQTINGITYTAHAIDIWNSRRYTTATKGPVTYGLTQQLAMRPYSVSMHTGSEWQNKSGSFSVTLQKPNNSNITFVLVAKKR